MSLAHCPDPGWTWLGFGPGEAATGVAAVLGAAIAALVVVWGYRHQQIEQRREQRATLYAESLRAVEDYLEMPYLIARRDGSHQARMQLVERTSDIQSRIAFHGAWMSIHAPASICNAYADFVAAARSEAGTDMTRMWTTEPIRRDSEVPRGMQFERTTSRSARDAVAREMSDDLSSRKRRRS